MTWCRSSPGPMGRLRVGGPTSGMAFRSGISRQGKGSAIRDRSGIQSEPSRRKGPGVGEGEMTGNEKSTDRGLSLAERKALRTKGCLSNRTALAMVFKLLEAAQKSWRRLDGTNQLPKLVLGVTFNDGIEVIAKPTDRQPTTAAA